ncbi:MAG: hypothetical protein FWF09_01120 [Bacteroidales bacterium]|nr:hypothetical protein [Bacteroidales bacterium]
MKYFCRLLLLLLLCLGISACSPKKKMIRQMEKDQRAIKKMEQKELKMALKMYKMEKDAWLKQQTPEVRKRLKEQEKQTKKFYKPYGKQKCAVEPPEPRSKYKDDGIKK